MTTVSGIIRDTQGNPLAGVNVSVRYKRPLVGFNGGAAAQNVRLFTADGSGEVVMADLVPGRYDIQISVPPTSASGTPVQIVSGPMTVLDVASMTLEAALDDNFAPITPSLVQQAIDAAASAAQSAQDAADSAVEAAAVIPGNQFPVSYEPQTLLAGQQAQARENISAAALTDADIVVNIPSDYPTWQAAIDDLSGTKTRANSRKIINIEAGHEPTHGLALRDGDYGDFILTADDPEVNLAAGFVPVDSSAVPESSNAVFYFENCRAPRLSCLIRGGGTTAHDGLIAWRNVQMRVDAGCGVENTRMNCEFREACTVAANGSRWSDALRGNMRLTNGVQFSVSGATLNNGWTDWTNQGGNFSDGNLRISRGSSGQAQELNIDGAGARAVAIARSFASFINSTFANVGQQSGSTTRAVQMLDGSIAVLRGSQFDGSPITASNVDNIDYFNVPTRSGLVFAGDDPAILFGQSGSGRFRKTADGVLECWGVLQFSNHEITNSDGVLFRSNSNISFNFPEDFISAAEVSLRISITAPSGATGLIPRTQSVTATGASVSFLATQSTTVSTIRFSYHAIGKYK